ncbi:unnamed protein product, partial [Effrenium voratum]
PGGRAMHRSGGIWVLVKLTGSLVPCTRPVISAMARQLRVQLPAGHGGWKTMALTGPLLCAIAALAWPLSDYVESFESAVGSVSLGSFGISCRRPSSWP